jgi:hypothetical protein
MSAQGSIYSAASKAPFAAIAIGIELRRCCQAGTSAISVSRSTVAQRVSRVVHPPAVLRGEFANTPHQFALGSEDPNPPDGRATHHLPPRMEPSRRLREVVIRR